MATTNLQQWNPTAANQETDAQYSADSQRSGGATTGAVFASPLGNKLFYQVTTFLVALFQAFANKGFTTSDANLSTLTAQCANFLTTADVKGGQNVGFSATPTFDCSKYSTFQITLTGNVTALTVSGAAQYEQVTLAFVQDGTGGRTVVFPANVLSPGTPDTTPGATSTQTFVQLADGKLHPSGPMVVS